MYRYYTIVHNIILVISNIQLRLQVPAVRRAPPPLRAQARQTAQPQSYYHYCY